MSDGVEQRVAELYGKIGKLFDEVPAKVCLDVLVNAAANVLCQVHIDKDKARIDGWNFGKNLDMVIAEKFDAYREGMAEDDSGGDDALAHPVGNA